MDFQQHTILPNVKRNTKTFIYNVSITFLEKPIKMKQNANNSSVRKCKLSKKRLSSVSKLPKQQNMEIRRIKLKERAALPPGIRQHAEAGIAQRLFSCALYQAAREIFCYASYGSEADTSRIIAESLRLGKRTAVPKVTGERRMEFYYISSMEELSHGYRGIPEPEGRAGTEAVPAKDALIILPGAAFDRMGNRLGYGGGFYDTYLASHPQAGRAAIAFSVQIAERIPSGPYDIRPDIIFTEKEMIQCIQDSREIP